MPPADSKSASHAMLGTDNAASDLVSLMGNRHPPARLAAFRCVAVLASSPASAAAIAAKTDAVNALENGLLPATMVSERAAAITAAAALAVSDEGARQVLQDLKFRMALQATSITADNSVLQLLPMLLISPGVMVPQVQVTL